MIIVARFVDKGRLSVDGITPRGIADIGNVVGAGCVKSAKVWIDGIYGYVILDVEIYVVPSRDPSEGATAADTSVVVGVNCAVILSVKTRTSTSARIVVDNVIPYLRNIKTIICSIKIVQGTNTICRRWGSGSHPKNRIRNMNLHRSITISITDLNSGQLSTNF